MRKEELEVAPPHPLLMAIFLSHLGWISHSLANYLFFPLFAAWRKLSGHWNRLSKEMVMTPRLPVQGILTNVQGIFNQCSHAQGRILGVSQAARSWAPRSLLVPLNSGYSMILVAFWGCPAGNATGSKTVRDNRNRNG